MFQRFAVRVALDVFGLVGGRNGDLLHDHDVLAAPNDLVNSKTKTIIGHFTSEILFSCKFIFHCWCFNFYLLQILLEEKIDLNL